MDFWKIINKIYTLPSVNVDNHDDAVKEAQAMGYPVVCKVWSDNISHKSDVGGVVINITNRSQLITAMDTIVYDVIDVLPDAKINGFTIQKMAPENGVEMICGIKKDAQFGHVILFGLGGIYTEIFNDVDFKVVPFSEYEAIKMITEVNSYKLLKGFRGAKSADLQSIVEVIMELQNIVKEHPEIEELDINPLICYPNGVVAVDGRVF